MSDCQFCCQPFTTQGGKKTRNLACGHTICNDCAHSQLAFGEIMCRECGEVTKKEDRVTLPLSHSIIKMLAEPQCLFHVKNWERRAAKHFCNQCRTVICVECSNIHAHHGHTIDTISFVANSHKTRLSNLKSFYEKELRSLKPMNDRLVNLKVRIAHTEGEQCKRLQLALFRVLCFEGIRWHSEMDRQLLALVSNYKKTVAEKQMMVARALSAYERALADLEEMEKANDVDLVFQEREIINLEKLKIPHNDWEIPEASLDKFHPVILSGRLYLRTMKFTKCHDLDPSEVNRFLEYMRNRPGVFNIGPQKYIVYSHDDIYHLTFDKTRLSLVEPHQRMFCTFNQNQVHLYKEDDTWNLLRVYDAENIDAYIHPDDGEKFDLGNRDNKTFEKYWNEIVRLGKLAVKHIQIIYPTN